MLSLSGIRPHGFFTEEIRESGKRTGFQIKTLEGRTGILSHVDQESSYRVGRYGVNLEDLEAVAVPAILPRGGAGEMIVIDEIGTMELFSEKFKAAVIQVLDSQANVIATIKQGGHHLIKKIMNRPDVELLELSLKNRGEIPEQIADSLSRIKNPF